MIREAFKIYRTYGLKPALKSARDSFRAGSVSRAHTSKYQENSKLKLSSTQREEGLKILKQEYVCLITDAVKLHNQFDDVVAEYMYNLAGSRPKLIYMDELNNGRLLYKPDFSPATIENYNYVGQCILVKNEDFHEAANALKMDISQTGIIKLAENDIWNITRYIAKIGDHSILEAEYKKSIAHINMALYESEGEASFVTDSVMYEGDDEPMVSIIIPNCDHVEDLRRCVDSLLINNMYSKYEIIIVENNSKDQATSEYYEKLANTSDYYMNITGTSLNNTGCVGVRILHWKGAFNFSAINNYGVSEAKGELVLLLNNDTKLIKPYSLDAMVKYATRENVGAVGACLLYANKTIQHAGVIVGIGPDKTAVHPNAGEIFDSAGYGNSIHYVRNYSAVTAACLMVRKNLYEQVGGLDENFAVAYNDIDFCLKLRKLGLYNVYTPEALLFHFESQSRGSDMQGEKHERFLKEAAHFREKWEEYLTKGDPFYNINLSKDRPFKV